MYKIGHLSPTSLTSLWRCLAGIVITGLMAGLMVWQFPPFELLEVRLLDARFKFRGPIKPNPNVVIAAIDEKSLQELGRWPWDRKVLARLVDRLAEAGAAIIAFDVLLADKAADDPELAAAISRASNVILPLAFDFRPVASSPELPLLVNSAYQQVADGSRFDLYPPPRAGAAILPIPVLAKEAMAFGHISMLADRDGTLRWDPMAVRYGDRLYPPLAFQAATAYLGIPPDLVTVDATRGIQAGTTYIPTDHWGQTVIPYYGPTGTFPTLSIAEILDGTIPAVQLQNKLILIGATATGIYDLRVTPFSASMPGVEKHASMAAALMDKRFISRVPDRLNLAILVVSGLLLTLILNRVSLAGATAATALALLLLLLAGQLLFTGYGQWLNLAYPGNNFLYLFIGITAFNYAVEERRARKIRAMFSSYVTQTIVTELIDHPDKARLGGERREVSILFSDIVGFTTFSEQHSPEEVVAILNEYLGEMTDVILKWKGTLDKFIGDAIVVFWGAPLPAPDHAELAIRCALEMQERLKILQEKWDREGKPVLASGIGINTGEVLVGNIGAEGKKMEYTVIGDQVNLGSRVEGLTRRYGSPLLVTENTVAKLGKGIEGGTLSGLKLTGLERVIVKGRELPVGIFAVERLDDPAAPSRLTTCPAGEPVRLLEK